MEMSLKPADTDMPPVHRHPAIPCKQEIVSALPYREDEGSSVYVSEELGSSSGSNDGTIAAQHDLGIAVTSTKRVFVTNHPLSNQTQSEIKEDLIKGCATPNAKMTKKPAKPLACPRCNSWDTKFCYYNNYNVNQPRHFCKNCQRYWTAGGTLRNVPVGAGCRKHKNSATQQKQCTSEVLSERSAACQPVYEKTSASKTPRRTSEITTGHSTHLRSCLVTLAGGPLGSLDNQSSSRMLNACQDMAATSSNVLGATAFSNYGLSKQIAPPINMDQKTVDASHNVLVGHRPPLCNDITNQSNIKREIDTLRDEQPTDESASASCITSQPVEIETCEGNLKLESPAIEVNAQGEVTTDLCGKAYSEIHGSWHYGVNSTCNEPFPAASVGVNFAPVLPQPNPLAWNGASGNVWASLPWPIMQSAMCIPQSDWVRPLVMPWGPGSTPAGVTPSTSVPLTSTGISTAADSEMSKPAQKHRLDSSPPEAGEGCLWVPKTLRIDDPVEAARSSIWETLGIADGPSSLMICNPTKALRFNPMKATDEKQLHQQSMNHAATRSPKFSATDEQKLHHQIVNPAATRSLNFAATDEKKLHQQSMNPAATRAPNVGHSS